MLSNNTLNQMSQELENRGVSTEVIDVVTSLYGWNEDSFRNLLYYYFAENTFEFEEEDEEEDEE